MEDVIAVGRGLGSSANDYKKELLLPCGTASGMLPTT